MNKRRLLIVALLAMVYVRFGQTQEITKFRVPEYDETGRLKSQIYGDLAKVRGDDSVEITRLKIEFYRNEEVDILVTAPHCVYYQKDGRARSDSSVRIARDQTVITGEDFSWDMKKQQFVIRKKARVVLKDLNRRMNHGDES